MLIMNKAIETEAAIKSYCPNCYCDKFEMIQNYHNSYKRRYWIVRCSSCMTVISSTDWMTSEQDEKIKKVVKN